MISSERRINQVVMTIVSLRQEMDLARDRTSDLLLFSSLRFLLSHRGSAAQLCRVNCGCYPDTINISIFRSFSHTVFPDVDIFGPASLLHGTGSWAIPQMWRHQNLEAPLSNVHRYVDILLTLHLTMRLYWFLSRTTEFIIGHRY